MRYKYSLDRNGKPVRAAVIYTRDEHGIEIQDIDADALFVCRKLRNAGYESYIVGGAVRDLLLGKKPKDFDVATSAHPRQVKRILPRSRIIGKRFRLVHVVCPANKIIEVATFRSDKTEDANVFGTLEEDVRRRDFSCNALYYDPKEETVVDYVQGVKDIRARVLKNIIPLEKLFVEDPVRMLRAVKYSVLGGIKIGWNLGWKIKAQSSLLAGISPSRLTEEFYKILFCGRSQPLFEELYRYGILGHFLPNLAKSYNRIRGPLKTSLSLLDAIITGEETDRPTDRAEVFYFLLEAVLLGMGQKEKASREAFEEQIDWIKDFFRPIVPSNRECDLALRALYKSWGVRPPRPRMPRAVASRTDHEAAAPPPVRRRRRRRRKSPTVENLPQN